MKKITIICLLVILGSLSGIKNILAFPFIEVEGYVTPGAGTITDNLDGTTTFSKVDYSFTVTDADSAYMSFLKVEFEKDVFSDVGTLAYKNPATWNTSITFNSGSSFYQLAFGTPINKGESFTFSMMDMVLVNDALTSSALWQEGHKWSQSFSAMGTGGSFPVIDGGSTSTPEPGTFLLLGTGLVGIILYTRKKRCLLSI